MSLVHPADADMHHGVILDMVALTGSRTFTGSSEMSGEWVRDRRGGGLQNRG